MSGIAIHERDVTAAECELMSRGIDDYAAEHGDMGSQLKEGSFVAMDGNDWVGVASGWAPLQDRECGDWFYLAELFVEAKYRGRGIGSELLRRTEETAGSYGVGHAWTWTAGYEAPSFYAKQGYSVFAQMQDSYTSGHARVGLSKSVMPHGRNDPVLEESVRIEERQATEAELAKMNRGFEIHSEEHGNPRFPSERIGFVAFAGEEFVGTSTGLVSRKVDGYSAWFRITELVVVKQYRGMGVGMELLEELESKLVSINVRNVWLWAADYEASFFLRHGYEPFYRMEKCHPSGHARIGLQKSLGE